MDIKIDQIQQPTMAQTARPVQETSEDFKFTLMSSLEEDGGQAYPDDGRYNDAGQKAGQAYGCKGHETLPEADPGVYE